MKFHVGDIVTPLVHWPEGVNRYTWIRHQECPAIVTGVREVYGVELVSVRWLDAEDKVGEYSEDSLQLYRSGLDVMLELVL